jgi:hypothetical protein
MKIITGYPDFIRADNPLVIISVADVLVKVFRACRDFMRVVHGIVIFDGE